MAFEALDWFCQPMANSVWAKAVDSAFGSYTPCAIDSLVVSSCHLVLLGLCLYRTWLIKKDAKVQRFHLTSNCYSYVLATIAGCCFVVPLIRLAMGVAIFSLDHHTGFAPFEVICSIVESLSWCSVLVMVVTETKIYIREFRWYIRFGLIYVLVGDVVLLNLLLPLSDYYSRCYLQYFFLLMSLIWNLILVILPCNLRMLTTWTMECFLDQSMFIPKGMLKSFPSSGVLCEAQYYQNVMRVGFRLRSTLVAAIFHKSLRLTHEGRKKYPYGKITNMISTDADALQELFKTYKLQKRVNCNYKSRI